MLLVVKSAMYPMLLGIGSRGQSLGHFKKTWKSLYLFIIAAHLLVFTLYCVQLVMEEYLNGRQSPTIDVSYIISNQYKQRAAELNHLYGWTLSKTGCSVTCGGKKH